MSYIDFFEFKEHPFRITPDVEFYFTSDTHSQSFESLRYFVESDEGFCTLIGEPGTGKTITLRKFLNELSDDIEYAYILFPSLAPEDMFRAVLEDFGYKIEQGVSKNTLFSGFRDFLTEKKKQGKRIILIIDEAQNLPVETLEELRILSNLETEKEKLIQFVLAGQPELNVKLSSNNLRQLKQRITLQTELKLLNTVEIERYVVFRLSKAGFNGQYPNAKFYKKLSALTGGNPRLINLTMERALMAAYINQSKFIVNDDLDKAAESLKLNTEAQTAPRKTNILTPVLIGVIIILAALLALQLLQSKKDDPVEKKPVVQEQAVAPAPEPKAEKPVQPEPVKVEPEAPAIHVGYITVNNLNLRSTPTTTMDNVVAKLNKGLPVIIKSAVNSWIQIETFDQPPMSGWVYKDYIIIPE